ncbi:MAG TPA: ATP-binding protein [Rhizobiaceae bacterium]|nr:ATP-binding protein [Rhizobiaceae bacterium]
MQAFGATRFTNGATATANRLRLAEGPLELNWRHCGTTSDFLGEFFAACAGDPGSNRNEIRHSIGYLVNELLENALKFRALGDIAIETTLEGNRFEMRVTNVIEVDVAEKFQAVLTELTTGDPGQLLIEKIERNAAEPDGGGSGLGLLTLMNDYGAQLGWKFIEGASAGLMRLETYASLSLS